jgi:hypothetical protein
MAQKTIQLPKYTRIKTHSPIGKDLGGLVELNLKVRIPKNMLRAVVESIKLGYMAGPTVEAELNRKLLLGLALEIETHEEHTTDFAWLITEKCGLNFQYNLQEDEAIESIIENEGQQ